MAVIMKALISILAMALIIYLLKLLIWPIKLQVYRSMALMLSFGIKILVPAGICSSLRIIRIFLFKAAMMMPPVSSYCLEVFVMVKFGDHQQALIIRLRLGENVNFHQPKSSRVGALHPLLIPRKMFLIKFLMALI